MANTEYLYAVQDETGREVVSAKVAPAKVGDVVARLGDDGAVVSLVHGDVEVARATVPTAAEELYFHRVPADDKLANPVTKRVR